MDNHFIVEEFVDVRVPLEQEELARLPTARNQARVIHNLVGIGVVIPRPRVVEQTIDAAEMHKLSEIATALEIVLRIAIVMCLRFCLLMAIA